jgi:hypothetical protein
MTLSQPKGRQSLSGHTVKRGLWLRIHLNQSLPEARELLARFKISFRDQDAISKGDLSLRFVMLIKLEVGMFSIDHRDDVMGGGWTSCTEPEN